MSKMFIQLRRLVFLLVFLQCCACVVIASSTPEPKKKIEDILSVDNKREFEKLRKDATETVIDVERVTKEGRSCLEIWKKVVDSNKEAVAHAKAGIAELDDLVKKIKEKADIVLEGEEVGKKKKKLVLKNGATPEELKALLVNVSTALKKEESKEPMKLVVAFEKAGHIKRVCSTMRRNIDDVIVKVDRSLEGFKGFPEEVKNDQNMTELKEGCVRAQENLPKLQGKMVSQERDTSSAWKEARDKVKQWKKSIEALVAISNETEEGLPDVQHEAKTSITQELEEIKAASLIQKEHIEGPKADGSHPYGATNVWGENRTKREADAIQEINGELVGEFDVQAKLMEEEEKKRIAEEKVRKAAEEKRRVEEERRRIEEEAKRVEEEKKKAEEEKAIIAAEEKKKIEEKKRRAEEEKARQEAAQKAKEEEAKRVAAEKQAKKKKDGSSSPALVHSSLILLVLCVLGCTLMC